MIRGYANARRSFRGSLLRAPALFVGEWQSQKSVSSANTTYEVRNASFAMDMPHTLEEVQRLTKPNLPWAEDHFQERVSGEPLNPPPSNEWWPFARSSNAMHKSQEKFSHTYPERFWPKYANPEETMVFQSGRQADMNVGIRYAYGDLDNVVTLLAKSPATRQAFLPIWFPEDTGSVFGQRVPCTLGYHLMIRDGRLHTNYFMRSCDFLRHFPDDIYMAIRLAQWIVGKLDTLDTEPVVPGELTFFAGSLHVFEADLHTLRSQNEKDLMDYVCAEGMYYEPED